MSRLSSLNLGTRLRRQPSHREPPRAIQKSSARRFLRAGHQWDLPPGAPCPSRTRWRTIQSAACRCPIRSYRKATNENSRATESRVSGFSLLRANAAEETDFASSGRVAALRSLRPGGAMPSRSPRSKSEDEIHRNTSGRKSGGHAARPANPTTCW